MSEFKREARYIVIKTSDLAKVPTAYRSDLVDPLSRLQAHLPNRDFVVVESDWHEYEPVWQMIEARMNGEPNALDAALAREADLREELALIIKSFDELAASVGFSEARLDQTGDSPIDCANQLQQRLTDAEKLAGDLEGMLRNAQSFVEQWDDDSQEWMDLSSAISNAIPCDSNAALKPAAEGEGS